MTDIRQSPAIIDDFDRSGEDPIASPWAQSDGAFPTGAIKYVGGNGVFTHRSGQSSGDSYLTDAGPFDGDDAEVWGWASGGGGGAASIAWSLGLWSTAGGTDTLDGYYFRQSYSTAGSQYLYRLDNGSSTIIASSNPAGPGSGTFAMLLRRNGNYVEGWQSSSSPASDFTTLTLMLSAYDTTYTTGFYLGLGIADNSYSQILGWDWMGGGFNIRRLPQIYRYVG